MIDARIFQRALTVGLLLQITMVVLGHYVEWVALNVFRFGGMFISGVAGLLYARDLDRGWGAGAFGGTFAGGLCALIGVIVSVMLHDTPPNIVLFAVPSSALTGAVGGLFGQMAANIDRSQR